MMALWGAVLVMVKRDDPAASLAPGCRQADL